MKKRSFITAALMVLALGAGSFSTLRAQSATAPTFRTGEEPGNPKARVTFQRLFKNASHIIWSSGNQVYFISNSKISRAWFNQAGKLVGYVQNYTEEYLPSDILYEVKSTYFGRSIFGVTEISNGWDSAYLIDLQDKTSWLRIRYQNGVMTEERLMMKTGI